MKTPIDSAGEERLRALLRAEIEKRRPNLSARELARRCARYGYEMNESYIAQFLSGARRSLSFRALRPISSILGIPYLHLLFVAGYLSDQDLEGTSGPFRAEPTEAYLCLTGLSPAGRERLLEYYEFLRGRHSSTSEQA